MNTIPPRDHHIHFDVTEKEKRTFKEMCRANDQTMAQVIRRFMFAYVNAGPKQPVTDFSHFVSYPSRASIAEDKKQ